MARDKFRVRVTARVRDLVTRIIDRGTQEGP